jgi:hypothetical protein
MTSGVRAVPYAIFGASLRYIIRWRRTGTRRVSFKVALACALAVALGTWGVYYFGRGLLLMAVTRQIRTLDHSRLNDFLRGSVFRNDKYVLGAATENPHIDGEMLHEIALKKDPGLHRKMWSLFPIMGDNGKGLAVMRLVVLNPKVRADTVELLSKSSDEYVLGDIAGSDKASVGTLRRLYAKGGDLIEWGLVRNPNTPSDLLEKLKKSDDQFTREMARYREASTPRVPSK